MVNNDKTNEVQESEEVALDTPSMENNSKKIYKCKICGKILSSKRRLEWHVYNVCEFNHKCDRCNKTFPSQVYLQRHEKKCINLQCDKCFKILSRKQTYLEHIKRCKGNKTQEVLEDGTDTSMENNDKTQKVLENGSDTSMENNDKTQEVQVDEPAALATTSIENNDENKSKKIYKCKICGKILSSKNKLEWHLYNICNRYKPECDRCKKTFPSHMYLQRHQKICIDLQCEHCLKILTTKRTYFNHIKQCKSKKTEEVVV